MAAEQTMVKLSPVAVGVIEASLKSEIIASVDNIVFEGGVMVYDVGAKRFMVEVRILDITGAEEQA